jgi:hypothetical protein
VVASSSTQVKQDLNEYMWTMTKDFNEPEPFTTESSAATIERDNLTNIGREINLPSSRKIDLPE